MKRLALILLLLTGTAHAGSVRIADPGRSDVLISSLYKGLVLDMSLKTGSLQSSTVASDRSGSYAHITSVVGDPVYASDGVTLDGNDYLKRTEADWRGGDSQGTVALWVKPANLDTSQTLFGSADEGGNNYHWFFSLVTSGQIQARQKNNDTADIVITTDCSIAVGAWNHVVWQSNDTSWSIYLNSISCALSVISGSNNGDWLADTTLRDSFSVGVLKAVGATQFLTGTIANLKIWDRALSAPEVAALFAQGRAEAHILISSLYQGRVLDMPLVAGFTQSATVASDLSGSYAHGTATGTPPVFSDSEGVDLNGTNDYILIADDDAFSFTDGVGNDKPFTISAWVNMVDATSFAVLNKDNLAGDREWTLTSAGDDKLYFVIYTSTNDKITRQSNNLIAVDEGVWTHFAATYSGNETSDGMILYRNGVVFPSNGSLTGTHTGMSNTGENVTIGRRTTSHADGKIQNVLIHDRALSPSEMAALFNQGRN